MKVMSQVGIDLMKLCETDGFEDIAGFQYVITAQCYFTKYSMETLYYIQINQMRCWQHLSTQALKEVCKESSRNANYKYEYKCDKDDY